MEFIGLLELRQLLGYFYFFGLLNKFLHCWFDIDVKLEGKLKFNFTEFLKIFKFTEVDQKVLTSFVCSLELHFQFTELHTELN